MGKLNVFQKSFLIIVLIAVAAVSAYFYAGSVQQAADALESGEAISFSKKSGFYNHSITVKLEAVEGAEIYYTMDGSKPSPDNPRACLYEDGIMIEATEEEYACTIKAGAFADGALLSDTESRTYIMGINVNIRYSMPVLSVSGSPEDFYNYEDGIMVHGKLDAEYIAAHPEWKEFFEKGSIPVFGNFYQKGRAAEKEVFVTLFDKEGNELLSQNSGFRLYGAISRMKNQPSFRLYARSEYDEINDFDYTFFTDKYTHENTLQSEYKRIIVRNGGNDNGYGFIRSELATRIAREAGFTDAPAASPVCVYLNGEYYGVHWFVTNFDDNYFRETYGEYSGEMYLFEGTIEKLEVEAQEEDAAYVSLAEAYNKRINLLMNADLTEEDNWQELNQFMDVDNFIMYMALQHYLSNSDSLHNNYRIYRYYAPDGLYTPETVFDGRYRFLLFDLDQTFGLTGDGDRGEPEKFTLTADRIDGDETYEKLFAGIMQREDCRNLYIRYTFSFMNGCCSERHVAAVLEEMHVARNQELTYLMENTDLLVDNHQAPDDIDADFIAHQMFLIRRFAQLRPDYVKEDLMEAFGEMTSYTLHVANPEQAYITLDFAATSEHEFTGSYFQEVPVQISVQPRMGYEFAYWLINGEREDSASFAVNEKMISEGQVDITCVCKPAEDADLCISGVKVKGGDFIELTNLSMESRNLGEYCLSDNFSDTKSSLPDSIIKPGETVTVYCKNYGKLEALGKPMTNFNIKAGETVSLYGADGSVVDAVAVPELGSSEGVWRVDFATGEYKEKIISE